MTVLLDTNVLSELLRSAPDAGVLSWFGSQPAQALFVSSVTQAEMMLGARLLPPGRKRQVLERTLEGMFEEEFDRRILPFDRAAVPSYVDIVTIRRAAGRPISQFDAQIASIARLHGARLATRNTADFEGCGVTLVNPWSLGE